VNLVEEHCACFEGQLLSRNEMFVVSFAVKMLNTNTSQLDLNVVSFGILCTL
jgi:hypothetical protein